MQYYVENEDIIAKTNNYKKHYYKSLWLLNILVIIPISKKLFLLYKSYFM